ncbi:MAG TPA: MBL fold metallo-hydrolase [Sphingomicrobium sp.]|nr:MBL fold metallo-hydrolase [Sphingomicrobium sp.]
MVTLTSLGGAGTVTGSKHLLEHEGRRLLIDCGLFQGPRELRELNWSALAVEPKSIGAIVLTHAHLDHSGYLPRLVRQGFRGPVYATPATIDVARLILLDSAFLQEKDAEFANRHGFSRHRPALPLYTRSDAELALSQFRPVSFHEPFDLGEEASLLFRRAGHILGAATAEVRFGGSTIVFSGDLGRFGDDTMIDPEPILQTDYLLIESTYGDRLHPKVNAEAVLEEVIERTVRRGGTLIIPAFAVGRTQSLLYELWMLKMRGELPLVPIYVDSPMATNATDLMSAHMDDHRLQPMVCREAFAVATYVRDTDSSKALSRSPMPKVIISASGMATGGRVLHHIKAFGQDPRNTILFAGFQAPGTRGRALIDGLRDVKIHGDWIEIRAEIADLTSLSAHADSDQLIRWLEGFASPPRETFVVHGEPNASSALRDRIERELGWRCTIPAMGEEHRLGE